MLILLLAFFLKERLSQTENSVKKSKGKVTQGVAVDTVHNQAVRVNIPVTGRLRARNQVKLYAEVSGILLSGAKDFEEGQSYQKGESILRLEDEEVRAAYQADRSAYLATLSRVLPDIKLDYPQEYPRWQNYLQALSNNEKLPAPPSVSNAQLKLFLTGAQVYSAYQGLVSTQERLRKFNIRAPFAGTVTEALVEEGALIRPGQVLGEFMASDRFDLVTSVSPQATEQLAVGDTVRLYAESGSRTYLGEIYRINAKVDPNSQQVPLYIQVEDGRLRDGQYLRGSIAGRQIPDSYLLDRSLIFEKNKVFKVADTVLQTVQLQVLHRNPTTLIVRGLKEGDLLPRQTVPGAYDGLPVKVIADQ